MIPTRAAWRFMKILKSLCKAAVGIVAINYSLPAITGIAVSAIAIASDTNTLETKYVYNRRRR